MPQTIPNKPAFLNTDLMRVHNDNVIQIESAILKLPTEFQINAGTLYIEEENELAVYIVECIRFVESARQTERFCDFPDCPDLEENEND